MAGVSWEVARDLVVAGALVAGQAWSWALSTRLRSVHRRLSAHVCGEVHQGRHRLTVAELARREQSRRVRDAAGRTQPIPMVDDCEEVVDERGRAG